MARTRGAKNTEYEERRSALLDRLRERLARPDAPYPSYRELADACEVSQTTLRHYFGRREHLVTEVLAEWTKRGREVFEHLATPSGSLSQSVEDLLGFVVVGQRLPELRQLHRVGIAEGLRSSSLGMACVDFILEPALQAIEVRLARHMEASEMRQSDPRAASIELLAPVLIVFMHQEDLGGRARRPLDIDAFVSEHATRFIAAHAP